MNCIRRVGNSIAPCRYSIDRTQFGLCIFGVSNSLSFRDWRSIFPVITRRHFMFKKKNAKSKFKVLNGDGHAGAEVPTNQSSNTRESKKRAKRLQKSNEFSSQYELELLDNLEQMNDEELYAKINQIEAFDETAIATRPYFETPRLRTSHKFKPKKNSLENKNLLSEQFDRYRANELVVALVGLPNVGKSTLYNRLVCKNEALVTNVSGTTRDRRYGIVEYGKHSFLMIDTGGIHFDSTKKLSEFIHEQAVVAIEEANLVVFLVDYERQTSEEERKLARMLRKLNKPVLLVVNKCDNSLRANDESVLKNYERLGFGRPITTSAYHGLGSRNILDHIVNRHLKHVDWSETASAEEAQNQDEIRVAIVGVPNVGKSSLLNSILGRERSIVHSEAGTTTDPIDEFVVWKDKHRMRIVDTAGIRKRKSRIAEVEQISVLWTLRAIRRCQIVLLVLDGAVGANMQDVKLSSQVLESYKSCIVVVNKWDLSPDPTIFGQQRYEEQLRQSLSFWEYIPILFVSAKTRFNSDLLMDWIVKVSEERRKKISPQTLLQIIQQATLIKSPPSVAGKKIKFKFAFQFSAQTCPSFVFFVNTAQPINDSYQKFLQSVIRKNYPFTGTPVRLIFKKKSSSTSPHKTSVRVGSNKTK